MVHELKNSVEEDKVFFGIKQCLKKSSEIGGAVIVSDSRDEIKKLLKANGISFREIELSKREVAERLSIDFECEVFGIRK